MWIICSDVTDDYFVSHYCNCQVDKSRAMVVQQLFAKGLGVHHAGKFCLLCGVPRVMCVDLCCIMCCVLCG